MRRFYTYLDWHVRIPRIRHGERSSIETLISEEALLLAMCLRGERKDWTPRIGITDDSIGIAMKQEPKTQNQLVKKT
jgi:hypothetical protein